MEDRQSSPPLALKALALAACLLPPALLWWRLWRFPGWELTDESYNLSLLQGWREGGGLPWAPFHGCLHRALAAAAMALGRGRLGSLWLLNLGVYAAFLAALAALARRLFGPHAAWAALAVSGLAALPAVQLGSLLSPQLQPLTWALLALAAVTLERPWAFALWGLACGAALLDYEGWALAWPGAMALLLLRPAGRRGLPLALAGFFAAAGWVFWRGGFGLGDYIAVRQAYSQPPDAASALAHLLGHLRGFFLGRGSALPTQGVPGDGAQFPLWALPCLAAAVVPLFRPAQDRGVRLALAVAAALPFGAFLLYAPAVPSERVLAAWPALCLLAGERLAAAWRRSQGLAWVLLLLAAAGGAWALRDFTQGMDAVGPAFYNGSGALLDAARDLGAQPPLELFSELDAEPRGDFRLALGRLDQDLRQGPAFALVPWQSVPALQ
ncbi:MAG TPA: hypothetical protein VK842_02725, partial [bacterium]|nr:hypothetical protein [bacterium]